MTIRDDAPEPIPGLEDLTPAKAQMASQVEAGVRRTLAELHRQGHVTEVDSARTALAVELSRIIATKSRTGRLSTVANDARVLMELIDNIVGETGDVDEQLRVALEEWAET